MNTVYKHCRLHHYHCTVSLSLFAGLEQILRRFSVFAEEPRKSIIIAIEPCNPVFKEVQPRPSQASNHSQSVKQFSQFNSNLHLLYKMFFNCIFIVIKHPTGLCQNKRI